MKQIATPVIPATSPVIAADKALEVAFKAADAALKIAYEAADKTIVDTATNLAIRVGTAEKAITDNNTAANNSIAALTTTVAENKTAADKAIASAIADWDGTRPYKVGNKVMVGKAFFICLKENTNINPLTDTAGNWGIFNPGSENDVFANRSPTSLDVKPAGIKWWDVSFGSDTPLGFISLGNGAWAYLNQISLSRIRFYATGQSNTYRSSFWNIKFFKTDGTQIPFSHFVWGSGSGGVGRQNPGVAYSGQGSSAGYNSSGWIELEPSASFDPSVSISKVMATGLYINVHSIQFYYSNGGVKAYTGAGFGITAEEKTLTVCDPVLPARYGDALSAALGETLTSTKLSNPENRDSGRITGESFVAAFNALYQAQPQVLQTYQQETIDALTARIAALEAQVNPIV